MFASIPDTSLKIAQDSCSPASVLRQVYESIEKEHQYSLYARQQFVVIKEAMARNPNTPPDVLKNLVGSFPAAFCQNPVAPLLPLEAPTFIIDLPTAAQFALLRHVPPASLIRPLTQTAQRAINETVWEEARHHIVLTGELEAANWENAFGEACREFCTGPNRTPEEKQTFSDYIELGLIPHWHSLLAPLPNRDTSDLEATFGENEKGRMLAKILAPDAVPDATREIARQRDLLINLALVLHPHTPPDVLKLITHGSHLDAPRRRFFAALHPNASPEILLNLAGDRHPAIRRLARKHPNAANTAKMVKMGRHAAIEKSGGNALWYLLSGLHGKIKTEEVEKRLKSTLWLERVSVVFALARRPDGPARRSYVTLLSRDTNRFVRAAAKACLAAPDYRFSW